MPYVQRDAGGNIIGRFANRQPGYAEEFLQDDAPEIVALASADAVRAANAPILAQLAANDVKIVRAITEGDSARVEAHKEKQAALRAQLIKP